MGPHRVATSKLCRVIINRRTLDSMFSKHLTDLGECETLRQRVTNVLSTLPQDVLDDLLDDPRFSIAVDNYEPGKGSTVWMATPSMTDCSRSIVLRPKLAACSEEFAHYVIAHEFAHAYLRNGGWNEITDREEAADALAAHWGYARPDGPFPW